MRPHRTTPGARSIIGLTAQKHRFMVGIAKLRWRSTWNETTATGKVQIRLVARPHRPNGQTRTNSDTRPGVPEIGTHSNGARSNAARQGQQSQPWTLSLVLLAQDDRRNQTCMRGMHNLLEGGSAASKPLFRIPASGTRRHPPPTASLCNRFLWPCQRRNTDCSRPMHSRSHVMVPSQ